MLTRARNENRLAVSSDGIVEPVNVPQEVGLYVRASPPWHSRVDDQRGQSFLAGGIRASIGVIQIKGKFEHGPRPRCDCALVGSTHRRSHSKEENKYRSRRDDAHREAE